ncbi:putative glycerol uptake facilitator protein [uncultured Alphaproteobacteria bacterium]|uniref:Putative glycerol uptake facilitator protein n=1 Tax=uncultured Alphaproteobacteria bacterium TaxID=91750 RepID=A0A212IVB4_9PROT|nr:putative glycerol uptake facilitator protein [uncultured Alphaproteobacteria bacterium]
MTGPVFGELLGTLVLVYLGDSVVANVLLNKSKGQNSGWIVITTGWGFAVVFGILTSLAVGGVAHINPAVTLALAVATGDWSNVVPFIAMQMVGAFLGAILVYVTYLPHWAETEDPGFKLGIFCTGPAIRNLPSNAVTEGLGTILLVVAGMAIGSKGVAAGGLPAGFGPFLWGILVWGIGLALGGPTGYAINPARDLGPRIAHAILPIPGKGGSDWGYSWVPVIGPFVGGAIGGLIVANLGIL